MISMGQMTDDMTRLNAEINIGRLDRDRLRRELAHSTGEMKRAVSQMTARVRSTHAHMAREQRERLHAFVSGLHDTVMSLRTGFVSELAGARAAFFGAGSVGESHKVREPNRTAVREPQRAANGHAPARHHTRARSHGRKG